MKRRMPPQWSKSGAIPKWAQITARVAQTPAWIALSRTYGAARGLGHVGRQELWSNMTSEHVPELEAKPWRQRRAHLELERVT
jgi:hypothetical protein